MLHCEFTALNIVCSAYTCKMGELPSFGQRDDPSSLATWTGQTAAQCKALCLSRTDCDAFTYVKENNTCIAHRKIVAPKKASCCSYWAKTCPGVQGEGSECEVLVCSSFVSSFFRPIRCPQRRREWSKYKSVKYCITSVRLSQHFLMSL